MLRYLECQNAETLKAAIDNSTTFIMQQCGNNGNQSHNKILSESRDSRDPSFRPGVPRALVARSLAAAQAQAAAYEED